MGKRSFALLLALVLTATLFSACTKGTTGQTETTAKAQTTFATDNDNFKLSYTQSDSLDPFAAKTQNNQVLADLVFESLFDLDGSYTAQPNLATGYEFTNSTTLKVIVPSGLTFSDKSALTVADVVYSFEQAKNSPAYGSALQGIRSATAEDNNTVVFTLRHPSPYGQNLLTFPIAKANAKGKYPIGSGRYRYKSTQDGPVLAANVTADFNPHITTIHLVNIAAADSIDNAVNIGNITYAYRDLSENSAKRMTATKKQINQNNLVYIGFNNRSGAFANAHLRKAVSLAVDRNALAKSAYAGYATAARSVYNPAFGLAASTRLFAEAADAAAAKQQHQAQQLRNGDSQCGHVGHGCGRQGLFSARQFIRTQISALAEHADSACRGVELDRQCDQLKDNGQHEEQNTGKEKSLVVEQQANQQKGPCKR